MLFDPHTWLFPRLLASVIHPVGIRADWSAVSQSPSRLIERVIRGLCVRSMEMIQVAPIFLGGLLHFFVAVEGIYALSGSGRIAGIGDSGAPAAQRRLQGKGQNQHNDG